MEIIPQDPIFKFNSNTLQDLRKQYDLDKPGRIEEAIALLEEWLTKQDHFVKKEFPRDYLERTIILSKGSVERAKAKLDKICTFRTIFPHFFGVFDIKEFPLLNEVYSCFLPKLTDNHYRIIVYKNTAKRYDNGILELYRYFFLQCEYMKARDYCNGVILFLDYTETNIMETMKFLNAVDLRDFFRVLKEGYGMRLQGIHLLSSSKAIEMLVALLKQVTSAKLSERILSHKTMETVYEYIPKDFFPEDYGGKEKSLLELHKQFQEILVSKDFTEHLIEMNSACTDEKLRKTDNPDAQLMGPAGTFRKINVD